MREHGSPKIITTDKLPSYSAAFREIGFLTSNYVEAGPATDIKIHTYRFDGESEQCSYLKQTDL